MKFLTNIDLNRNEIQNVVVQNLAADPTAANSKEGQIYYNTTSGKLRQYVKDEDGNLVWMDIGSGGGAEVEVPVEKSGKIKIDGVEKTVVEVTSVPTEKKGKIKIGETEKTVVDLVSAVPATKTGDEVPLLSLVETLLDDKVDVDGDTMTGDLKVDAKFEATGEAKFGDKVYLHDAPTDDKEATTKKYVDDLVEAVAKFKAVVVTKLPADTAAKELTFYFMPMVTELNPIDSTKSVEFIFNSDGTLPTTYSPVADGEEVNWNSYYYFLSPTPVPTAPVMAAYSKEGLPQGSEFHAPSNYYGFKMPVSNSKWTYLGTSAVNMTDYLKAVGGETKNTVLTFTKPATVAEPASGAYLGTIIGQMLKNESGIEISKKTSAAITPTQSSVQFVMPTIDSKYTSTIRWEAHFTGSTESVMIDHSYDSSTHIHTFTTAQPISGLPLIIDVYYLAKQV